MLMNQLRAAYGHPIKINSGARCEAYDKHIGGAGPHTTGKAADVACSGRQAYKLYALAIQFGMTGLGVKQHGDHAKRFLHFDTTEGITRPWIWSYPQ